MIRESWKNNKKKLSHMKLFKKNLKEKSNLATEPARIVYKRTKSPHSSKNRDKKTMLDRLSLHKEVLVRQLAHNLT